MYFSFLFFFARDALEMAIAKPEPRSTGVRPDPGCPTQDIIFHPFHPNSAGHLGYPNPCRTLMESCIKCTYSTSNVYISTVTLTEGT